MIFLTAPTMTCSSLSNIALLQSKVIDLSFVDQELSNGVFISTVRLLQQKLSTRLTKLTVSVRFFSYDSTTAVSQERQGEVRSPTQGIPSGQATESLSAQVAKRNLEVFPPGSRSDPVVIPKQSRRKDSSIMCMALRNMKT